MQPPSPAPDAIVPLVAALARAGIVRLHNARGGLACNSSSSHSIVILPTDAADQMDLRDVTYLVTDTQTKIRYLVQAINAHYGEQDTPLNRLGDLGRHLLDTYSTPSVWDDALAMADMSTMSLPDTQPGSDAEEFLADLVGWMSDERVALVGGYDWSPGKEMVDLPVRYLHGWKARKDTDGEHSWWVLFNQWDGTKLRLSMNVETIHQTLDVEGHDPVPGFVPAKAPVPELVDVKVTDACPFETDCGFCYMGSTRGGQHADPQHVQSLVTALARMGVFEIAVGGGEPSLWPGFDDLLVHAKREGITVNVTTKNPRIFDTDARKHRLLGLGAVAFSVNDEATLDRLIRMQQAGRLGMTDVDWDALVDEDVRWDARGAQITLQCIPDLLPASLLCRISAACQEYRWRLTLLGYKHTGRGAGFTLPYPQRPAGWWIQLLADTYLHDVAIDTALAGASVEALTAHQVPYWTWHTSEGAFSAYVDAVTGQMGPSSYCESSHLQPLDLTAPPEQVRDRFRQLFGQLDVQEATSH